MVSILAYRKKTQKSLFDWLLACIKANWRPAMNHYLCQVRIGGFWNWCPDMVKKMWFSLTTWQVMSRQKPTVVQMELRCHLLFVAPDEAACAEVSWAAMLRYSCRSGSTVLFWCSFLCETALMFLPAETASFFRVSPKKEAFVSEPLLHILLRLINYFQQT